ncbi:MAG: ComEC/Rec2 family competence protein, partial [Deltaproteobacteria bacterium]|nr:ComEC/Rec2 family competence protein [Deltaproteobacteria bacterium]
WLPFRKIAALVSIPAIALYCLIVGNRVPAVRSTIMGVVFAGAVLLGRRSSSLNSLALAAVLVLLVYPLSLCTPSAQMSFAAVFGILFVIEPVLERVYGKSLPKVGSKDPLEDGTERRNLDDMKKSMFRLVLALLVTPVAATVAVGPFLIAYFQSLPVYTLPANFVADLVMTAALPLSLLATAVGAVWPDAGAALLIPADILVWIVIKIAAFFADLPGSIVRVSAPGWLECGLFVGTCFAFLWVLRRPSRRTIAVCSTTAITLAAVVALVSWTGSFTPTLKVTFLNVGHGDAAFVRVTDSHGLLIDGGPRTRYFDSGSSILIPFLAWTGARCLDAIILTHPEADHMGGLVSVVREVPPRLLLRNTASSPDPMFAELLSAVSATNADVRAADRTCEALRIGQATVRFLNPPRPKGLSQNN